MRGLDKASWSIEDIDTAVEMLNDIITLGKVRLISVDAFIAKAAQRLIIDHHLYSADAIHIASALLSGVNVFITADKHQHKKHLLVEMRTHGIVSIMLSDLDDDVLQRDISE